MRHSISMSAYLRVSVAAVTMAVAASLLALVEPAEAAFPGTNGKISFSRNNDVFTMDANGSNQTNRSNNPAVDGQSAVAADGTKIVFTSNRDCNCSKFEIYLMNADGSNQTRLTNTPNPVTDNGSPAFSPDGTKIVFYRTVAGAPAANTDVYVMDAAPESASNQPIRLTDATGRDEEPVFSFDGEKIAFTSNRDGNPEIYVMDKSGNNETNLSNNSAGLGSDRFANFSPDGSQIAFASSRDGNNEVYVMDTDPLTNDAQRLTNNTGFDQQPTFSPDGSQIAFESGRTPGGVFVMNAAPEDATTNAPQQLAGTASQPDWGPADTTAPVTSIDTGPSGPTNDDTPSFTFSSSEGGTFKCDLKKQGVPVETDTNCVSPKTYSNGLDDGNYSFQVQATDASGNPGNLASRIFTVDTVAPDTTITGDPPGTTSDDTPSFTFTSSEANSTFECRLSRDGDTPGSFASCSSGDSFGPLTSDGGYTFEVKATDAAANEDSTPDSHPFTVDATPPETTIDTAPSDPTNDTTPTFTFSSPETGATFQCSLDNVAFSNCSSPQNLAVSEGEHTFRVQATDAVGNVDPTPAERAFTVDTTAPTVLNSSLKPANLAKNVKRTTDVSATFSEEIKEETLSVTLVNSKNSLAVTANVKLSPDGKTVTIDPVGSLAKKTKYIVTIKGGSNGVKDLASNALATDQSWSFTTKKK